MLPFVNKWLYINYLVCGLYSFLLLCIWGLEGWFVFFWASVEPLRLVELFGFDIQILNTRRLEDFILNFVIVEKAELSCHQCHDRILVGIIIEQEHVLMPFGVHMKTQLGYLSNQIPFTSCHLIYYLSKV
jgi:hypothetical protein